MSSLSHLLAPLALLLPGAAGDDARLAETGAPEAPEIAAEQQPGWIAYDAMRNSEIAHQVRIEQRVTIRITPRAPEARQSLMAELPPREISTHFEERKMGNCVPVANIVGVQAGEGSQLILFMRDRRIVSATLEKACRGRDYYSGFLVDRTADGMLCVGRDKLQSRAGANCQVSRMRQLVAVSD